MHGFYTNIKHFILHITNFILNTKIGPGLHLYACQRRIFMFSPMTGPIDLRYYVKICVLLADSLIETINKICKRR